MPAHLRVILFKGGKCGFLPMPKGREFRRAHLMSKKWVPVPSLDGRYELHPKGILRNARTKRKLKCFRDIGFYVYLPEKKRNWYIGLDNLKWEVFGVMPRREKVRFTPIIVYSDYRQHWFDKYIDAAKFLAPRVNLSVNTLQIYFSKRKKFIKGWRIAYMTDPMPYTQER